MREKNTIKKTVTTILLLFLIITKAQVGINTTNPDLSSVLDIKSDNKGLLIPRLNLSSENDTSTITSPATSLLVWNKGESGLSSKGFYYWDGKWKPIADNTGGTTAGGWSLNGNNIGNHGGASTNLSIGTASFDDFVIKANSKIVQRLGVDGKIAIGENAAANYQGISIGMGATGTSNEAIAIGNSVIANGYQSLAIGHNSRTNSNSETAVGYNSVTNGQNSTAIGSGASATGQFSVALGYGANTNQPNAIVFGGSNSNIGIGTSTPNVNTKLDVNGNVKIGQKGSVQKNQFAFSLSTGMNFANIQPGKIISVDVTIPASSQPNSTNAIVSTNPSSSFSDNFTVVSSKLISSSSLRIYLMNITENPQSIYYGEFQVFISEY